MLVLQRLLLYFSIFFWCFVWQGLTFPVAELFLEDVFEKTLYCIKSDFDNYQGNTRRRRRQQESKKDPITEQFEAWLYCLKYYTKDAICFILFVVELFMVPHKVVNTLVEYPIKLKKYAPVMVS